MSTFLARAVVSTALLAHACAPLSDPEAVRAPPAEMCVDVAPQIRAEQILATPGLLAVARLVDEKTTPKGNRERRLRGALLRYAAPAGVTSAWFQRQLECHQAEVKAGRSPAAIDDPYVSSSGWLTFSVDLRDADMVVNVRSNDETIAEEIVARGARFRERSSRH